METIRLASKVIPYGTAALFPVTAGGSTAETPPVQHTTEETASVSEQDLVPKNDVSNSTSEETRVFLRDLPESWSKRLDRRLHDLAIKEAVEEISEAELLELDQLQDLRRRTQYRPSPEEVLAEIRAEQIYDDLVAFFEKYSIHPKS